MERKDPDRWPAVDRALGELLEARTEDRAGLLDRLSSADPDLRRELESLLAAHVAAGTFLETPAEVAAAPYLAVGPPGVPEADPAGRVIGRYRVLCELGRGGMGTVYLAERADGEFEQRAALKIIRSGLDSRDVVDRFLRERQILARLQHPNIARLFDGGSTDDGLPYFVMERVEGTPLTTYCDRKALPLDARLRLFLVVCRAVQYAHRNLIVHRDLKPSNVLVTEGGDVKLLDFGIAKLLVESPDPAAPETRLVMTPEYASPEQVRGTTVTTASDVYQLGLILYELLTGRRPYQLRGCTPADVERVVCHTEPVAPSIAVRGIAEAPDDKARTAYRRRLRGDLDAITLTALRKEPDRRYLSAEAMADDVERHLAGLPIKARVDRVSYRAWKFVRRRWSAVAIVSAFLALTVGFAVFYTIQTRRERDIARLEAAKANESAEFLQRFFENWNPDAADRKQVSAEDLLRVSVARVERELGHQPAVQASMLSLLGALYTNLGRVEAAEPLLARALEAQRRLHQPPHPDVAATLSRKGLLLYTRGRFDEAESAYREALAMYGLLVSPSSPDLLRTRQGLGNVLLQGQERFKESEAEFREILKHYESRPDDPSLILADATRGLGLTLYFQARYVEAEAILRPLLAHNRRLFGDVHPVTVLTMQALSATVRDRGSVDEAETLQREVFDVNRRLYGDAHANTQFAKFVLALTLHRNGRFFEARQLNGEIVAATATREGRDHPVTGRYVRIQAYVTLDLGELTEAKSLLRRALAIYRKGYSYQHEDEAGILYRLAYVLIVQRAPDATQVYREAVSRHRSRPAGKPLFVSYGPHFLARSMQMMRETDEAETLYRQSLELYRQQLPAGHPYRAATLTGLGELLLERGQGAVAEPYVREAVSEWERWAPRTPSGLEDARALLARAKGAP